jgi:hypothetical protein
VEGDDHGEAYTAIERRRIGISPLVSLTNLWVR